MLLAPRKEPKPGTLPYLLLEAARSFETPFTLPDLILRAWRKNTTIWGLRYYETEHPDSNKVRACLYGHRGLIKRGFIFVREDGRMEAR